MSRQKITDAQFWAIAGPMVARNATYREIAEATNLCICAVRNRLMKANIHKRVTYTNIAGGSIDRGEGKHETCQR